MRSALHGAIPCLTTCTAGVEAQLAWGTILGQTRIETLSPPAKTKSRLLYLKRTVM